MAIWNYFNDLRLTSLLINHTKYVSCYMKHDGLFNYEGDTLATGGEDGVIKFWKVGNDVLKEWELKEEVHKINSLDFHINFKLVEHNNLWIVNCCLW